MLKLKTFEVASALFHVGGLSGAGALLGEGHTASALLCALVAALCVVILASSFLLVERLRTQKQPVRRKRRRGRKKPQG